jgi:hypothetical protein
MYRSRDLETIQLYCLIFLLINNLAQQMLSLHILLLSLHTKIRHELTHPHFIACVYIYTHRLN